MTADNYIYFIHKNDESLIIFDKNVYLELKRIEHEDGYGTFYHVMQNKQYIYQP